MRNKLSNIFVFKIHMHTHIHTCILHTKNTNVCIFPVSS